MQTYMLLALTSPDEHISLLRTPNSGTPLHGYESPAIEVMTDFRRTPAISVLGTTQIDIALDQMIFSGIRLLFVVDTEFNILGSITSYDIQGEKPVLYLQSRDCRIGICSREDISVQNIMTPVKKWQVLNFDGLIYATLGNILQTFRELGQTHIIVVERIHGRSIQNVRGLFSVSTLERALGIHIEVSDTARSFSEIKRELVRS